MSGTGTMRSYTLVSVLFTLANALTKHGLRIVAELECEIENAKVVIESTVTSEDNFNNIAHLDFFKNLAEKFTRFVEIGDTLAALSCKLPAANDRYEKILIKEVMTNKVLTASRELMDNPVTKESMLELKAIMEELFFMIERNETECEKAYIEKLVDSMKETIELRSAVLDLISFFPS